MDGFAEAKTTQRAYDEERCKNPSSRTRPVTRHGK